MAKNLKNADPALLDASAFIAIVLGEDGADVVEDAVRGGGACISGINLLESIAKLQAYDYTPEELRMVTEDMQLRVLPFTEHHAFIAAAFYPYIKSHNLSLGDRACLVVAMAEGYKVLTTDKSWSKLPLDVAIQLIR